jgi:hypothetical protein
LSSKPGDASCCFPGPSRREAEELRKEQWFIEELTALIWDGTGLVLRAGSEDEIKIYRERAQVRDSDELILVYLVPLDGRAECK